MLSLYDWQGNNWGYSSSLYLVSVCIFHHLGISAVPRWLCILASFHCVCVCVLLDGGWQTHSSTHPALLTTVTAYSLQLPLPLPLSVYVCVRVCVCACLIPRLNVTVTGRDCLVQEREERRGEGGFNHIQRIYWIFIVHGHFLGCHWQRCVPVCVSVCACQCVRVHARASMHVCVCVCVLLSLPPSLFGQSKTYTKQCM